MEARPSLSSHHFPLPPSTLLSLHFTSLLLFHSFLSSLYPSLSLSFFSSLLPLPPSPSLSPPSPSPSPSPSSLSLPPPSPFLSLPSPFLSLPSQCCYTPTNGRSITQSWKDPSATVEIIPFQNTAIFLISYFNL